MVTKKRPPSKKVTDAKKKNDTETLSALGREGATRRKERKLEKQKRIAEVDLLIDELTSKMVELDALLRVYSSHEKVDLEGDILPEPNTVDPKTIDQVKDMYLELKNQVNALEDKKADF